MTKLQINYPKLDEVIEEANRKGLTAYRIHKLTGLSTQTTYGYFSGERVSLETTDRIIEAINNYPEPKEEEKNESTN